MDLRAAGAERGALAGATRIANPGCYATAMMLALAPFAGRLDGPPHCFGVSGYSGAGATPSPRNDPQRLRDNVIPYQLDRPRSRARGLPSSWTCHPLPAARRAVLPRHLHDRRHAAGRADDAQETAATIAAAYAGEPFVRVEPAAIPLLRDAVGTYAATIGGIDVSERDARDVRVVSTLDNLLKGAASQAIQNVNLACGWAAEEGLR